MELITALDQVFEHTHGVIAGVRPEQYDDATPCEEWCVRDLLAHTIGVVSGMAGAVSGASRPARGAFELAADPAVQFQEAAAAALAGWRTAGVMDQLIDAGPGPMPGRVLAGINLVDTATHSWDLARATGQPAALPDDLARAVMEAASEIVSPGLREGRFGPQLDAAPDADATERLVAFLGRKP